MYLHSEAFLGSIAFFFFIAGSLILGSLSAGLRGIVVDSALDLDGTYLAH